VGVCVIVWAILITVFFTRPDVFIFLQVIYIAMSWINMCFIFTGRVVGDTWSMGATVWTWLYNIFSAGLIFVSMRCDTFFLKWEQERPNLCIKIMHTVLFIKAVSKVFKVLLQHHHRSIKVAANISQWKKEQAIKNLCDISNTSRLQPAILVEYSLNDRHQAIASSIQRFPLLHMKEVWQQMNQWSRPVNNL
jgi:hypothetical protein